jgi:ADP-heptose:LPS heptosyltransferase
MGEVYYDYWVPAMSAAYILSYEQENLSGKPYIKTNKKLKSNSDFPKIGLKWSGNPQFEHEQHRKFDPKYMIDLAKKFEADFYSFQRDEDLYDVNFTDLRDELSDWQKTAEYLMSMDLVITSCTAIAHMAGALGVKTWVVVPVLPYYVWANISKKTDWYENVTIYRQKKYGEWHQPFEEIENDLNLFLEEKKYVCESC